MTQVMTLTRKGRRALKSRDVGVPSALHQLILVVCDKIGDEIPVDNMNSMVLQLLDVFGTPETAIDAVNAGVIGFAKAN
jgi:hypothetical protein